MTKSVAHMILYKNTNRLGQRKVDLKEQCRRRLSNIRLASYSKNRPNLEQQMNDIISSTVQADSELTFEEQIQMTEELLHEMLEEEMKIDEARAQEEVDWMECVPVPCPNCGQADMIFETTNSRCPSCSFSFIHSHPSSFSLRDSIQSIQLHHGDRCSSPLSAHSNIGLLLACNTCQFNHYLH